MHATTLNNRFCLSSLTSDVLLAPCRAEISLERETVTNNDDCGRMCVCVCMCVCVMPQPSHTLLVAAPGVDMFCSSGMQLM